MLIIGTFAGRVYEWAHADDIIFNRMLDNNDEYWMCGKHKTFYVFGSIVKKVPNKENEKIKL